MTTTATTKHKDVDLSSIFAMQGIALVLYGNQGSGKTTLARHLATQRGGHYIETTVEDFCQGVTQKDILLAEPSTLIVEGLPTLHWQKAAIKALITNPTQHIREPYSKRTRIVQMPAVIFTTNDERAAQAMIGSRRFRLVRIERESMWTTASTPISPTPAKVVEVEDKPRQKTNWVSNIINRALGR